MTARRYRERVAGAPGSRRRRRVRCRGRCGRCRGSRGCRPARGHRPDTGDPRRLRVRDLRLGEDRPGFLLADDPPTVRGPDVAFIALENLPPGGFPRAFWTVPPDLAVEVVSPSNTRAEIREKVLEYLSAGTRLVWVVEPRTRSVTAYRSRTDVRVLTGPDTLGGHDVLPGFRLPVDDLFTPPDFSRD